MVKYLNNGNGIITTVLADLVGSITIMPGF
jgi:hypothetical protein